MEKRIESWSKRLKVNTKSCLQRTLISSPDSIDSVASTKELNNMGAVEEVPLTQPNNSELNNSNNDNINDDMNQNKNNIEERKAGSENCEIFFY